MTKRLAEEDDAQYRFQEGLPLSDAASSLGGLAAAFPSSLGKTQDTQEPPPSSHFKEVKLGEPLQLDATAEFFSTSVSGRNYRLLQQAEQQAQELLEAAKQEAAAVLESALQRAEAEAQAIVAEAVAKAQATQAQEQGIIEAAQERGYNQGYNDGYGNGHAQAAQESAYLLRVAHKVCESAYLHKRDALLEFKQDASAIMLQVLKQLVGLQLEADPYPFLESLLDQAIAALYVSGGVKVVVHPNLLQRIRAASTESQEALGLLQRYQFEADPLLPEAELYLLTAEGTYDLSPEHQLEALLASVEEVLPLPESLSQALDAMEQADVDGLSPLLLAAQQFYAQALEAHPDDPTSSAEAEAALLEESSLYANPTA